MDMLFRSYSTNRQETIGPMRVIGSSEPYPPIAETSTDSPSFSRFPTQTTDDFTSKIYAWPTHYFAADYFKAHISSSTHPTVYSVVKHARSYGVLGVLKTP